LFICIRKTGNPAVSTGSAGQKKLLDFHLSRLDSGQAITGTGKSRLEANTKWAKILDISDTGFRENSGLLNDWIIHGMILG